MKNYAICLFALSLFVLAGWGGPGAAAAQNWEQEFAEALERVRQLEETGVFEDVEGLGYTPTPEELLAEAIQTAVNRGGPGCQIMKMAVNEGFNPYQVIVNIYASGEVSLDELCMCSTEEGVSHAVLTAAARNATLPDGTEVFTPDEVTQSVCLAEGLPYTPVAGDPVPSPPPPDIPPDSVSSP